MEYESEGGAQGVTVLRLRSHVGPFAGKLSLGLEVFRSSENPLKEGSALYKEISMENLS